MATLPLAAHPQRQPPPREGALWGTMPAVGMVASALAMLGVLSIWPTALLLWALWTTDPLKSIGGWMPPLSLFLLLRVWAATGWVRRGTWWGLVLLALTVLLVHVRDVAVLELVLTPSWAITLPPHSVVAFAYGSGVALLFGGPRLWRAALFPLCLLLLVNPVPHVFSLRVDLPLQHLSAEVARGLAHALGQRLTPDQLTLMFTPDFGMFIAPGCNGIRGSVTMGLLALAAGYLYRMPRRAWAAMVAGGVLLGYLFNLLRLCVLVLYYVVALHWPRLQSHAEGADYLLGATLFFFAAMLLFSAIRRFSPGGTLHVPPPAVRSMTSTQQGGGARLWLRSAAFAVLVLVAAAPTLYGMGHNLGTAALRPAAAPSNWGPYRLRRSWEETLPSGQVLFHWAEYGVPNGGFAVQVGVSPTLGAHDTLLCHVARGEDWLWQGTLRLPTAEGPTSFGAALYNDGATQFLEASSLCTTGGCGQWTTGHRHLGLVFSRPAASDLLGTASLRPVPVLLRVELTDPQLPLAVARTRLEAELRNFAAYASFGAFTYRYRQP